MFSFESKKKKKKLNISPETLKMLTFLEKGSRKQTGKTIPRDFNIFNSLNISWEKLKLSTFSSKWA